MAATLASQIAEQQEKQRTSPSLGPCCRLPRLSSFRPDQVISLNDTIALYDFTYTKYPHVFRLIQPSGRQVLFGAANEDNLNAWISAVNYAASFRTAGIRMRGSPTTSLPIPFLPMPDLGSRSLPKASTTSTISAMSAQTDDGENQSSQVDPTRDETTPSTYASENLLFPRNISSNLLPHNELSGRQQSSRSDVLRVCLYD